MMIWIKIWFLKCKNYYTWVEHGNHEGEEEKHVIIIFDIAFECEVELFDIIEIIGNFSSSSRLPNRKVVITPENCIKTQNCKISHKGIHWVGV
jgi:hypothetical protein